jgi:hypothetical protein
MAQVVECLPSKPEALSSNHSNAKKEKTSGPRKLKPRDGDFHRLYSDCSSILFCVSSLCCGEK